MEEKRTLKILYAGSPLASSMVLSRLLDASSKGGFEIAAVLTNPPSPRGRKKDLIPTEVSHIAQKNGIRVFEFDHVKSEARNAILPLGADILVSFDYGRIFGEKFLSMFPLGGINVHPGFLPRYRGCTPVPFAILNGEKEIGVCVQTLSLEMDGGNVLAVGKIPLLGNETTLSLMDGDGKTSAVTEVGFDLLFDVLSKISRSFSIPTGEKQTGEAFYTPLLKKEDGEIDWNESAQNIARKIRAYTPWPSTFTTCDGVRLKILCAYEGVAEAAESANKKNGTVLPSSKKAGEGGVRILCDEGILCVTKLQWEKKNAVDWKSFLNGSRDFVGKILGN